ncbi:pyrroline-5-carboxylate reductase [Hydrogenibacillus sp. N12]|uniref:pyrroline-5-carboxylate reductase n=1 Tax=Hydrogenibacillus sp. N12 TaxID=2866627 RepID=UPI001C7DFF31|nr:pyrroline-5-carboxylate reductase [Hydrogenibacillus sp. N12]QZA32666.1 pyrroline-5-carboxylate reductase [Hydrogenibacillus sp. N12]
MRTEPTDAETAGAHSPLIFLGAGAVSEALVAGLLAAGADPTAIYVTNRADDGRLEHFRRRFGVHAGRDTAAFPAGLVVLAVKPADAAEALREHRTLFARAPLAVSVAAGIPLAALRSALGPTPPLARAMTNTSVVVRKAVTAISFEAGVPPAWRRAAVRLFEAVGTVVEVDEPALDAVTALAGSGPAYVYYLLEAMTAAGAAVGLSPELSARLARETVIGAGAMLAAVPEAPEGLRKKIMSPGGTTEAAIDVLDAGGFFRLVEAAIEAADRRAKALGERFRAAFYARGAEPSAPGAPVEPGAALDRRNV